MRPVILAFTLLLTAFSSFAAPVAKPYHLELQATPGAAFPFLSKWGTVDLHVYPSGVRANALWLNAFARNGGRAVTIQNPLGRMYVEVPIAEIGSTVARLAAGDALDAEPELDPAVRGAVRGIAAERYRLRYGPEAWIDIWTTRTLGEQPQYRAVVQQLVQGISPSTSRVLDRIPGVPLYVELNFRRFQKVPLVSVKKLTLAASNEEDALTRGRLYVRASLLESLLGVR
jgi:hypothetical protein